MENLKRSSQPFKLYMTKTNESKKRYAIVGLGGRSHMYLDAIMNKYQATSEVVGICDTNRKRLEFANTRAAKRYSHPPVPTYAANEFGQMIKDQRPDIVIVTSIDRTHHQYIIQAMDMGCDVITEKPMTVDAEKCQAIVDAVKRTGRDLRVTFNYRYSPSRTKVKELLMQGAIGEVKSVHFEWMLDTQHGADYFRRWHRDKKNSGGLMVHKSTHHFDLVNWWLNSTPQVVFGFGSLAFYGRANGEARGVHRPYFRSTGEEAAKGDPFALDLRDGDGLEGLYYTAEKEDGYIRDQNVFGDGISIEDTMNLVVRYQSGAQMSYSLTAYSPWEGYRVAFNGTKGRLEFDEMEKSYISAGNSQIGDGLTESQRITVFPHWQKPYHIDRVQAEGGHGGGDILLLEELFGTEKKKDPFGRAANFLDGAQSILTGIAANQSFATGQPVRTADLVRF